MSMDFLLLAGGVGMFLLGMDVMTRALKEAAGANLRRLLARFTTTPLRGVATGAAATAVIQSSSATTVMTVGFVGAGLMSMGQALGILYGANIGTTATGWLVSILGFKLDLDAIALAVLLPASLALLLGQGALERAARVVAGLCLLLVGLDLMQTAMGDATGWVTPDSLPGRSVAGLLLLGGIGVAVTVLIQSSSAAVALALVMLDSGAIGVTQAAAMVVGMNIGTTFTALLASVGGSRPMRQTAVANLGFNLVTAGLALPVLALGAGGLERFADSAGPLNALLVFHSGFNLAGTCLFVPFTRPYARLVASLVPAPEEERLISLDPELLSDPGAALEAAQLAAARVARRVFGAMAAALSRDPDYRALSALEPRVGAALDELEDFLAGVTPPRGRPEWQRQYSALLHQTDHLRRLLGRSRQRARLAVALDDPALRRPALLAGALLGRAARDVSADFEPLRLARLEATVKHRTERHRRGLLLGEHAGLYTPHEVFAHTDAMRWLQRVLHHAERIAHYDALFREHPRRDAPPEA